MSDKENGHEKLSYTEIEVLEVQGKKYTGNRQEQWIDAKSICSSCRYSHIMRQHSKNTRSIYCTSITQFVPEDINECNSYQRFTDLSIEQMGQIAIILDPRPDRYKGYL